MNAPEIDSERLTFLRAVDDAADLEVDDFEARFIESALRYQTTSPAFSDKQRSVIDRMWCKYGPRLRNPQSAIVNRQLPETVPGKCAWLLLREGAAHRTRCGLAVAEGKNFCAEHMQERARVQEKLREANRRKLRA